MDFEGRPREALKGEDIKNHHRSCVEGSVARTERKGTEKERMIKGRIVGG